MLSQRAAAYLSTLPPLRARRANAAGLGMLDLIAALVDEDCVLVHGPEGAPTPMVAMMGELDPCGACLTFPHQRGSVILYVWREGTELVSIALRDGEARIFSQLAREM